MADVTRDEMRIKWMGIGEALTNDEVDYLIAQNVEPGFNDHASLSVLGAYRAGYEEGIKDRSH